MRELQHPLSTIPRHSLPPALGLRAPKFKPRGSLVLGLSVEQQSVEICRLSSAS